MYVFYSYTALKVGWTTIKCIGIGTRGAGGAGGAIAPPLFSLTLLTDQKPFIIPFLTPTFKTLLYSNILVQ